MNPDEVRAKVFISCGQQKDTDEVDIAHKIKEGLDKLGYDPYIAVEEQTLKGVKENILKQLETAEYFIFIDFKREQILMKSGEPIFRGSLFSHQELAIASFLDIPVIAFQEKGVKKDDGILRFIQANCVEFTDRSSLPQAIADYAQKTWNPHWKNEIFLERDDKDLQDVVRIPGNRWARFFHIKVVNRNRWKSALNCLAYLQSIRNIVTREEWSFETVELKWKGVNFPDAVILPSSYRRLDGFFVHHDSPNLAYPSLSPYVDFTGYFFEIKGPGDFELTYSVLSQNFRPTVATFALHLGTKLEQIVFQKKVS
jgi:hypothetical protein